LPLHVLFTAVLTVVASVATDAARMQGPTCRITRIVDGDTVHCSGVKIRLLLIDSPERKQRPFGQRATQQLARLIPVGTTVRLEYDLDRTDRYGRTLAYLYTPGGTLVNEAMVRQGFAVPLVYPPNVRYVERIRAAASTARAARAGLWAVDAFDCLPVDARKRRC
jgi:micrococcal nuclease